MAQDFQNWLENALKDYVYHRENKVCVVSMIGKAPSNELWTNGAILNQLLNKRPFQNIPFAAGQQAENCRIDAFFDPDLRCVFLNLTSPYDLNVHRFGENSESIFHDWWVKEDEEFASTLLFLFAVSQIVLFVHPTCRFDLSYIRLFRNVNLLREQTLSRVCDLLSDINGVSKGWASDGRSGCPRVLFLFHRPPSFMKPDGTVETRRGSYRKLAVCLEDQIYKLFRKSRVVTNNTVNSACSLPPKQSFCYIFGPTEEQKDLSQELMNHLLRKSSVFDDAKRAVDSDDEGFREFFFEHCDLAHAEGFDDNLGKAGHAHFELPRLKAFVRASTVLFDFFVSKRSETPQLSEITNLIDVVSKFSEGRCNKVLPIAVSSYQDNSPAYYTEAQHLAKLAHALQVLQQQARGPALEAARKKLTEECASVWRNGRRACEQFSLTGNPCVNRLHRTDATQRTSEDGEDATTPVIAHDSNMKFLCTCNCGRRQTWRDDPFDAKDANYTFYEENKEFTCCKRLDRIDFPIYRKLSRVKSRNDDSPEVVESIPIGRKISVEQLFDSLKITPTTQDDPMSGNARGGSDDFLPDRDNKPARGEATAVAAATRDSQPIDSMGLDEDGGVGSRPPALDANTKTQDEDTRLDEDIGGTGGTGSEISDLGIAKDNDDEDQSELEENEGAGEQRRRTPVEGAKVVAGDDDDIWGASDDDELYAAEQQKLVADNTPVAVEENQVEAEEEPDEATAPGAFIAGMVHSQCQPDLLPLFSSWSLVCLGHSSVYSHSGGLRDYPNFSHGSHFLLPWDVALRVDTGRWHDRMESMASASKRAVDPLPYKRQRPTSCGDDVVTVKIFLGFEYECPRGHRFMLQSPDKMLKFSGPGGPKDSAASVAKNDTPLWFPCSCRQAKPAYLGQLMRVHVVTPKAPVVVTINPKVQPHTNAPLFFYPGAPGPGKLGPAKYWILRLPFAYVGPNGPLFPPKDSGAASGRVLKGMIGVLPDL